MSEINHLKIFTFNFIVLKIMETKSMEMYEAPKVEIIEVEVEKGFASSSGSTGDYNDPTYF